MSRPQDLPCSYFSKIYDSFQFVMQPSPSVFTSTYLTRTTQHIGPPQDASIDVERDHAFMIFLGDSSPFHFASLNHAPHLRLEKLFIYSLTDSLWLLLSLGFALSLLIPVEPYRCNDKKENKDFNSHLGCSLRMTSL